jgi:dTDP-4-dehydrorhamnose reductase
LQPNVFDMPDIDLNAPWPRFLAHGLLPIRRASVNAMLFARETFTKHGLPLAEMFIWGEDTEFTLRVSRETPGYLVGPAKIVHVRDLPGKLDIRTEANPGRVAYHRYLKRNRIYIMRQNARPLSLLRQLFREAGIALELALQGRFDRAWIVLSGVTEGLFFAPRRQSADAPFDFTGVRTFGPEIKAAPGPRAIA